MNNQFNAFSIKVPGQVLDNLKYFQYSDFDSEATPTDAETTAKAVAYLRLRHVQRKLSELSVPVYSTMYFGTEGTASTVPTDAELVVSYISIDGFLSTLETAPAEADRYTAASDVLKAIVLDSMSAEFSELVEVQKTSTREEYAGSPSQETFVDVRNVYVTVPAVTPAVVVEFVQIKA